MPRACLDLYNAAKVMGRLSIYQFEGFQLDVARYELRRATGMC